MGDHTRLGCSLWYWEPFVDLGYQSRNLWLALYTSGETKRLVPGLWHGGHNAMANAAKMTSDETLVSLDDLIARRLVAFDQRKSVLRLTKLPDAGEKPFNGAAIRGWWNRFVTVPACEVRDSHVPTLRWILETAGYSSDHENAWRDTFGKLDAIRPSESSGPSGFQRLTDSDTSTGAQPGLFSARSKSKSDLGSSTEGTSHVGIGLRSDLDLGLEEPDRVTAGPADQAQAPRKLELVPPPADAPFSVDDVLEALALREDVLFGLPRDGLWAEIARLAGMGMGKPEVELLSRWAKIIGTRERIDILTTARLGDAVLRARRWEDDKQRQAARAAERTADLKAAQEQHATATTKA